MSNAPQELPHRLDVAGSRYDCYPTADRFVEAFTADHYGRELEQRRAGPAARARPLSLYVHIPFGDAARRSWSGTKVVTRHTRKRADYLRDLHREIDLHAALLQRREQVAQLHFGGGTPTLLSDAEIADLTAVLERDFALAPAGDRLIDADAATVDAGRIAFLAAAGFNRIGLRLQDVDAPAAAQLAAAVEQARAADFRRVDVELDYGLPRQTPEAFARTLALVLTLRPDRIALHAWVQRRDRSRSPPVAAADRPAHQARLAMLRHAIEVLADSGYQHIGLDQFALAGDPLAVARDQGRLHRHFHGYSTQPEGDLIGFGMSAIGHIGPSYSQNARTLEEYHERLQRDQLPVARGLTLSRDDLARQAVIMALVCQGQLQFESIEQAWLLDFRRHFAAELRGLELLSAEGLVRLADTGIEVTAVGRHLVRSIAQVFDRYLQADLARGRYSGII